MAIRVDGARIHGVYVDGAPATGGYRDGSRFFAQGGVPIVHHFGVSPTHVRIGDLTLTVAVTVGVVGATSGTLEEYLADGTRNVIETSSDGSAFNAPAGSSISFVRPMPAQNAHYALTVRNANGSITRHTDFFYGRAPRIGRFATAGFSQGIAGLRPNQVLLEWAVEDAVPPAIVDIETNRPSGFHYHPGSIQSGQYRYSQQGNTAEVLTLTATNLFGGVSQTLEIDWPNAPIDILDPPGNVRGSVSGNTITWRWDTVAGVTGWNVRQRVSGSQTWDESVLQAGTLLWRKPALLWDTGYEFEVQAVMGAQVSAWSGTVSLRTELDPATQVPVAPTSAPRVDGTAENELNVDLSAVAGATGYVVSWQQVGADRWQERDLLASRESVITVVGGRSYNVRYLAYNNGGRGGWSPIRTVAAAGAGGTPTGTRQVPQLSSVALTIGAIASPTLRLGQLAWSVGAAATGAEGWQVEHRAGALFPDIQAASWGSRQTFPAATTSFVFQLRRGLLHQFRIRGTREGYQPAEWRESTPVLSA